MSTPQKPSKKHGRSPDGMEQLRTPDRSDPEDYPRPSQSELRKAKRQRLESLRERETPHKYDLSATLQLQKELVGNSWNTKTDVDSRERIEVVQDLVESTNREHWPAEAHKLIYNVWFSLETCYREQGILNYKVAIKQGEDINAQAYAYRNLLDAYHRKDVELQKAEKTAAYQAKNADLKLAKETERADALAAKLTSKSQEFEQMAAKVKKLEDELQVKQLAYEAKSKEYDALKHSEAATADALDDARKDQVALQRNVDAQKSTVNQLEGTNLLLERAVSEREAATADALDNARQEQVVFQREVDAQKSTANQLRGTNLRLERAVSERDNRIQQLEEQVETLQAQAAASPSAPMPEEADETGAEDMDWAPIVLKDVPQGECLHSWPQIAPSSGHDDGIDERMRDGDETDVEMLHPEQEEPADETDVEMLHPEQEEPAVSHQQNNGHTQYSQSSASQPRSTPLPPLPFLSTPVSMNKPGLQTPVAVQAQSEQSFVQYPQSSASQTRSAPFSPFLPTPVSMDKPRFQTPVAVPAQPERSTTTSTTMQEGGYDGDHSDDEVADVPETRPDENSVHQINEKELDEIIASNPHRRQAPNASNQIRRQAMRQAGGNNDPYEAERALNERIRSRQRGGIRPANRPDQPYRGGNAAGQRQPTPGPVDHMADRRDRGQRQDQIQRQAQAQQAINRANAPVGAPREPRNAAFSGSRERNQGGRPSRNGAAEALPGIQEDEESSDGSIQGNRNSYSGSGPGNVPKPKPTSAAGRSGDRGGEASSSRDLSSSAGGSIQGAHNSHGVSGPGKVPKPKPTSAARSSGGRDGEASSSRDLPSSDDEGMHHYGRVFAYEPFSTPARKPVIPAKLTE